MKPSTPATPRRGGWLRLYNDLVNDPKVQCLPAEAFKGWINVLCVASHHDGKLPEVSDLAFALRMLEMEAAALIETLTTRGLLDDTGDGLTPHNWDSRQYKSDVSTERVKRFRKRSKEQEQTVSVTPSDSDSDSEANTESNPLSPSLRSRGQSLVLENHFHTFWRIYPKRRGTNPEKPALAKWMKIMKSGVSPVLIEDGARRYALSLGDRAGTQFVKQAVTWLNEEGWKDEYATGGSGESVYDVARRELLAGVGLSPLTDDGRPADDGYTGITIDADPAGDGAASTGAADGTGGANRPTGLDGQSRVNSNAEAGKDRGAVTGNARVPSTRSVGAGQGEARAVTRVDDEPADDHFEREFEDAITTASPTTGQASRGTLPDPGRDGTNPVSMGGDRGVARSIHAARVADARSRPPQTEDEQRAACTAYLMHRKWPEIFGPRPGESGSCVSKDLLEELSIQLGVASG